MSMLLKKLLQGEKRTVKAKKNILASFFIKGLDSLIYLMLVPVTLDFLNPYEYGIWLTLSSILMWINTFDIGLGNGMRNKLAEAMATNNRELARAYVSTTFIMLIVLMSITIFVGSIFGTFINWYKILGVPMDMIPHIDSIVYVSFVLFCTNFVFKFIGNVYLGMQLPAVNNLLVTVGNLLALVVIYLLTFFTKGSLLVVAVVYSSAPLVVYLLAYPITFKKIYPFLSQSFKFFKKAYFSSLFNVGIQFFILQISNVVLFACTNLLISHLFGPENVTPYNIAYRYFSLILMLNNLIMAPIWSATTDAYVKCDLTWIKKTRLTVTKILWVGVITIGIMLLISKFVYHIWIGQQVEIPFKLSVLIALYVCILMWSISYSSFINGFGKLKLQTINSVVFAIIFFPLSIGFGKAFGIYGVLVSMCIINLLPLVINKIQYDKIVNQQATGIWNK